MTGFLDLPPEIRNRIYFFCESLNPNMASFVTIPRYSIKQNIDGNHAKGAKWYAHYDPDNWQKNNNTSEFPVQPNVARVCRTIRNETLPVFYGASSFEIRDLCWPEIEGVQMPFPKFVSRWLMRIKPHISLIRDLEISCGNINPQRAHEVVSFLVDHFSFLEGTVKGVERDWSDVELRLSS